MRFDNARAMDSVERLGEIPLPMATAESRSADFLAEEFEHSGWRVERREAPCRVVHALVARWTELARAGVVLAVSAIGFLLIKGRIGTVGGAVVIALALLGVILVEGLILRARRPPGGRSMLVVARPSVLSRAACRVVFLSNLGALPASRLSKPPCPAVGSGPALLLGMARAWPKSWSERFDPVLVAAGGMNFGFAGIREAVQLIRADWPEKPTLLIVILAPGVGRELMIFGRPKSLLDQAAEAARGLWIPARPMMRLPANAMGRSWPVPREGLDHVVLTGASSRDEKPPPVDPDALGRAAQLVSEIALRWARQCNKQSLQAPDETRKDSRSSQKPG